MAVILSHEDALRFIFSFVVTERGCWEWIAGKATGGYGCIKLGRKQYVAHRLMYEAMRGPIKYTIDHLCRNRACVNPQHMEDVTNKVNILRGESIPAKNARKTHCKRGHEFTEANTYRERKGRQCRTCRALWHKWRIR